MGSGFMLHASSTLGLKLSTCGGVANAHKAWRTHGHTYTNTDTQTHTHTHPHPHIAWHTSGSGTLLIIEFSSICSPCCCSYCCCCCSSHSQPQIAFFARWLIFELFFFCRLDPGTLKHTQTQVEKEEGEEWQPRKANSRIAQKKLLH